MTSSASGSQETMMYEFFDHTLAMMYPLAWMIDGIENTIAQLREVSTFWCLICIAVHAVGMKSQPLHNLLGFFLGYGRRLIFHSTVLEIEVYCTCHGN